MEGPDNHIRILLEINEHVLIFLDSLKLPIRAGKHEVKIELSVGCELDFEVFADTMQLNDKNLDSEFLQVLEGLDLVRFLLHSDDEVVLLVVHQLAAFVEERVLKIALLVVDSVG